MNTNIDRGIVVALMPPGGWHFPQILSSGETVKLTAYSYEQILEQMLDFRRRHLELCGGADCASPEAVHRDLKIYICRNFKSNCADSPASPSIPSRIGIGVTNYVTPINKAADWLGRIGGIKVDRVDAALAAHRAAICAQCSMNVHWQTPCAPCNSNVEVRILNAKGSLRTPYDRSLQVCRVYGWTNEVAVWLTDGHVTPEQKPPAHCWKVQEEQHGQ